jgi:hypothetical protein
VSFKRNTTDSRIVRKVVNGMREEGTAGLVVYCRAQSADIQFVPVGAQFAQLAVDANFHRFVVDAIAKLQPAGMLDSCGGQIELTLNPLFGVSDGHQEDPWLTRSGGAAAEEPHRGALTRGTRRALSCPVNTHRFGGVGRAYF